MIKGSVTADTAAGVACGIEIPMVTCLARVMPLNGDRATAKNSCHNNEGEADDIQVDLCSKAILDRQAAESRRCSLSDR